MIKYDAILFIGFGGPEKLEDVRPFLEIVTRGRPIPPERLDEVAQHYEKIGGASPINAITRAQAAGLRAEFKKGGFPWPIYEANRNWNPFVEDVLRQMTANGVKRAIGFYTAGHRCEASLERYLSAVETARQKIGAKAPIVDFVAPWFDHPLFIDAITARALDTLAAVPLAERKTIPIVFTAHSIPCQMAKDSTYVIELQKTAELVCQRLGRDAWKVAYSSRSGSPNVPWLEPDICDEIRERAKQGEKQLLIIPIGFVADHVEVSFDLDVEAKAVAKSVGITFHRVKTVGTHPLFLKMIADVVRKRATQNVIPEMTSSKSTRYQDGHAQSAPGPTALVCYCQPGAASPPCLKGATVELPPTSSKP